jgi:hypothetical protein
MRSANAPIYFDDAGQLTKAIIRQIGKNIVLALPLGLGKANHVANSIFNRVADDPSMALRIFTALTLGRPRPKQELEQRFSVGGCQDSSKVKDQRQFQIMRAAGLQVAAEDGPGNRGSNPLGRASEIKHLTIASRTGLLCDQRSTKDRLCIHN